MTHFVDTINHAADAWFTYALHASWQSAVVGGALLLLTAILRKAPSPVRYAILVVALAKFAMPPVWSAPIGVFGLVDIGGTTGPQAYAVLSFESHRSVARQTSLIEDGAEPSAGVATYEALINVIPPDSVHLEPPAVTVPDPTAIALSWKGALMLVHLAGMSCICGWILMQFVKVRRLIARSQDISDNVASVSSSLARLTLTLPHASDVRVLLSSDAIGPLTAGVWRPVVVLPKWCERLSPRELDAVLMHELTHVRRRDTWWVWIELVVCAAWWFHPIAWLVRGALRSVREECCDDAILASHIAKPADYCDTLLRIAAATGARRAAVLACEMAPRLHPLGSRMRRIMDSRARRSAKLTFASLAAIVATAFVLLPGIVESDQHAARAETEPSPSIAIAQVDTAKAATQSPSGQMRTIRGLCVDQDDNPLANVAVTLLQGEKPMTPAVSVRTVKSGADGKFEMTDVELETDLRWNFIAAQSPGRATAVYSLRKDKHGELTLTLGDAATFSGTIRGEDGKPVANALVSFDVFATTPVGVRTAVTDEHGKFAITDLEQYDIKDHVVKSSDGRVASVSHQMWFTVLHPDLARTRIECTKIPNDVEIVVEPAAIIEGRIEVANENIDIAGLEIAAQPISRQDGHVAYSGGSTTVDQDGRYRLTSLVAGKYNISVLNSPPSLTAAAIDSFEAKQGQINIAPPMQLIPGGIIRGQLIDDYSGLPITFREGEVATIGLHGPSRPRSGAMIQSTNVAADGTFEIRAVPGANYIYLMGASPHEVVLGKHNQTGELREHLMQEVQVPDGDVVNVEIRLRRHAVVHNSSESVRREWENERAAIAAIEALGGWYETEVQNGFAVVVELNMVSHEDESGNRLECHLNTDEALFYVPKFKHLKRLILRGRQASDAGLKNVANLRELELLSIDDAHFVSDEGIAHLRSLPKLRIVGITHSRATDQSIAFLSEIPTIERLSMRWSQFTDQAFEFAKRLPRLQELSIDKGNSHFTDEATRHAAEMPTLIKLSLMEVPISDAGLKNLESVSTLRTLALSESSVTAAAIARLQAANPKLRIWANEKTYASLQELQTAVDPQQIEINAREALVGLATIEKYLELMANGAKADATKIAERHLIREYRHYQPVPDTKGFRILEAYGDGNEVMALTTATFSAQAYDSNSDSLTRQLVTQIFLRASRQKDGSWKVTGEFDTERPHEAWQDFVKRRPGARKLKIAADN